MSDDERPSRREREKERHRQEILEAARRVVEARGLGGVTVEEVAKEAEFAVGSIYRHFRSKDELVELLVVRFSLPLAEAVDDIGASGAPFREQLQRLVELFERHYQEKLPLLQVFMAAGAFPLPGSEASDLLSAARQAFVTGAERIVRNGQEEGLLPEGDPRTMTLALVGMMSGILRWKSFGFPTEDRVVDVVPRAFLEGFARR